MADNAALFAARYLPAYLSDSENESSAWDTLSKSKRCYRYEAARNRMGLYVLSQQTILDHLTNADGDVDRAVTSLQSAHTRALAPVQGSNNNLDLPRQIDGILIPYMRSTEQERRAAADIIPLLVNNGRSPENRLVLSRAEAALILEVADGDLELVVKYMQDHDWAIQVLHHQYDKLRVPTGTDEEKQEMRDAMLAHLIHMTDRGDWWSVHEHLVAHKWNLVTAVAVWQKSGIPPVQHPKDKAINTLSHGFGRRKIRSSNGMVLRPMPTLAEVTEYISRTDVVWKDEPSQFTTVSDPGTTQQRTAWERQAKEARNKRPVSFIIHHDRYSAQKGCPDDTKFTIEYIAAEKYRCQTFEHRAYFWPEFSDSGDAARNTKPLYDPGKQGDVDTLNNWRRENYSRITGITPVRGGGSEWSDEELGHLYDLFKEVFDELKAANGGKAPAKFKVKDSKKAEWATQHEAKFPGTKRTASAMISMATRITRFCQDFGLKPNTG